MSVSFPPYLAFGKLDETSIYEEDGFHFAHYLMNGELIHEFGINDSIVQITDIVNGRRARWSFARDINKMLHLHFGLDYDFSENNPIIERLSMVVRNSGNFYVSLKNHKFFRANQSIAPWYKKILVRVPLAVYDLGVLLKAYKIETVASSLVALYPVFIQATEEKAGIVSNIKYLVANLDFVITIATLPEFCRILVNNNLISAGKMYRAIVMELEDANFTQGLTIPGNISDGYFEYAYSFQEHFLHYAMYWGYTNVNRATNWINQYNKWQDSLKIQSSSFQYCILPFILKKIFQEGFSFQTDYSIEEITQSKIFLRNDSLWLENTHSGSIHAEKEMVHF
jgi:hypothetical protein